ncbi:hypothetical protein DENSPDRAFT_657312 [Dentipellis sp. KUC8613]|nr:hypothetical protein DENSPDRAFT_657312 [Dentipellis sp. KUC8613]
MRSSWFFVMDYISLACLFSISIEARIPYSTADRGSSPSERGQCNGFSFHLVNISSHRYRRHSFILSTILLPHPSPSFPLFILLLSFLFNSPSNLVLLFNRTHNHTLPFLIGSHSDLAPV